MTKARQVSQFTDPALDRQIKEIIRAVNATDDATEEVKDVVSKVIGVEVDDPTKARDGMLVVDARNEAWANAVEYASKTNTVRDGETFSTIKQTAQEVTGIVTGFGIDDPLNPGSYSLIRQGLDEIHLKVNKDEVVSAINLSPEGVRISGEKITLDGRVAVDGALFLNGNRVDPIGAGGIQIGACTATAAAYSDDSTSRSVVGVGPVGIWTDLGFDFFLPPSGDSDSTQVMVSFDASLGVNSNGVYRAAVGFRVLKNNVPLGPISMVSVENGHLVICPVHIQTVVNVDERITNWFRVQFCRFEGSMDDTIECFNCQSWNFIYLRR